MFLPVLLVHDFGPAGWVVFAAPNVIGAGAMGWVLARPGSSEAIVRTHRAACVGFTAVTLAFHAFFLFWMGTLGVVPWWGGAAAVGLGSAAALAARRRSGVDLALAAGVFAVSLVVLIRGMLSPAVPDLHGTQAPVGVNLAFLLPVCAFGFALCPYLDLTFHRAVQATAPAGRSRLAFGLGFGLFFLAMIVLTLLYEGDFNRFTPGARLGSFGAGLLTWVATHMAVQAGFTWTSHLRALPAARRGDAAGWTLAMSLAVLGAAGLWLHPRFGWPAVRMGTGEVVYRTFMGFYGLIFPAYVWICMVPRRGLGRTQTPPTPVMLASWAAAVLLAGPFFWIAFIGRDNRWLGPGLVIVILARWAGNWFAPRGRMLGDGLVDAGERVLVPSPGTPGEGLS